MFYTILILLIISALSSFIFKTFLYDIISLPITSIYSYKKKFDPYKQKVSTLIIFIVCGLLLITLFTYLFTGISASFLSYAISKNVNSDILKSLVIAISLGTPYALKDIVGKMAMQDDESIISTPHIFAAAYIAYTTTIASFSLLFFPEYMRFWYWMPYIN